MSTPRAAAAVVALLVLASGCGGASAPTKPADPSSAAPVSLTQRSVPHATFRTPADWKGGDDGGNHVVGGSPVEDYAVYQNKDSSAEIEYQSFAPPAQAPSRTLIRQAIDQGLRAQQGLSKAQVLSIRETAGDGCLPNGPFSYVEKPSTKETDDADSLRYGYTCTSRHGPIRGYSLTAYDWLARKHTVTVTASTSYWGKHREQMKAVVDSFHATSK